MSTLSSLVDRLKSLSALLAVWDDVKDKVKAEAPEVFGLLDALARDDYQAGARELLSWGSVVDVVAGVLEALDRVLPEEKLIALMERAGLPREG